MKKVLIAFFAFALLMLTQTANANVVTHERTTTEQCIQMDVISSQTAASEVQEFDYTYLADADITQGIVLRIPWQNVIVKHLGSGTKQAASGFIYSNKAPPNRIQNKALPVCRTFNC